MNEGPARRSRTGERPITARTMPVTHLAASPARRENEGEREEEDRVVHDHQGDADVATRIPSSSR